MAAVLCLVFLPLMTASVGFIATGTVIPGIVFFLLSAFIVVLALQLSRSWESEKV